MKIAEISLLFFFFYRLNILNFITIKIFLSILMLRLSSLLGILYFCGTQSQTELESHS
jgi:hypothetical protein